MLKLKDIEVFFNNLKNFYWAKDISFFVVDNSLNVLLDIDNLLISEKSKQTISEYHDYFLNYLQYNMDKKEPFTIINNNQYFIYQAIFYKNEILGGLFLVILNDDTNKTFMNDLNIYNNKMNTIIKMIEMEVYNHEKLDGMSLKSDYFSKTLDFVNVGLIIIDINGNIEYLNNVIQEKLYLNNQNANILSIKEIFKDIDIKPFLTGKQYKLAKKVLCKTNNKLYDLILFSINKYEEIKSIGIIIEDIHKPQELEADFQYSLIRFQDIIGEDNNFKRVIDFAKKIALKDTDILILGESGTGKEIFARSIHNSSNRRKNPFIAINCSAIPNELLESELFGYQGGAFTGASKGGKPGKFELADGGTIFLDEIGDMSYYLQAKLLRIVQERVFERVGGIKSISVDIRIIAATNKDLRKMVNEGNFREDLYYRLNIIPLLLPAVRDRTNDVKVLIDHYLKKYSHIYGNHITQIEQNAMNILLKYNWPGNVREIDNTIQFLCCVSTDGIISEKLVKRRISFMNVKDNSANINNKKIITLKELESDALKNALIVYGNSAKGKEQAAKALGIGLSTLYKKLKDYNIDSTL